MRQVFADTFYWVALLNPRDNFHQETFQFSRSITNVFRVTTEEVLVEVLNFFSDYDALMKQKASRFAHGISNELSIRIIEQTHASFQKGLELYEQRLDQGYKLNGLYFYANDEAIGNHRDIDARSPFCSRGFHNFALAALA